MQDLRITLVQANQIWEDKLANLAHYEALLKEVKTTDLIVLPEMFHTCFSMRPERLAEKMDSSIGLDWLKKQADTRNAAFYTSLIIEEDGKYFNRGVFVEPDGTITEYDKRKRFGLAGEDIVFAAGNSERIVHYKGWNINLQICYDLRFPENVRNYLVDGEARYDVIIYVANWPERRSTHWTTLLKARAIENQAYVVGVNRVGEDANQLIYSGDSLLISALGETISNFQQREESVETHVLKMSDLHQIRENLPFLKDSTNRSFEI
jgi:omega-amidase